MSLFHLSKHVSAAQLGTSSADAIGNLSSCKALVIHNTILIATQSDNFLADLT